MKKTGIVLAGAVLAAGLVYVGKLWAQNTGGAAAPAAPLRTRIALVNLHYVVPNYHKYKTFQAEMKKVLEPYQQRDKDKRALLEKLKLDAQKPENVTRRDQMEAEAKVLTREIEDNGNAGNRVLQKKSEEQLKILYKDVRSKVAEYAQAHDFELVLSYNEGVTEEEYFSGVNIIRKLRDAPCMPMYYHNAMDISLQVVQMLNGTSGVPTAARTGG